MALAASFVAHYWTECGMPDVEMDEGPSPILFTVNMIVLGAVVSGCVPIIARTIQLMYSCKHDIKLASQVIVTAETRSDFKKHRASSRELVARALTIDIPMEDIVQHLDHSILSLPGQMCSSPRPVSWQRIQAYCQRTNLLFDV